MFHATCITDQMLLHPLPNRLNSPTANSTMAPTAALMMLKIGAPTVSQAALTADHKRSHANFTNENTNFTANIHALNANLITAKIGAPTRSHAIFSAVNIMLNSPLTMLTMDSIANFSPFHASTTASIIG